MNEVINYPIDFFDDTEQGLAEDALNQFYLETENRIAKLAKGHTDITGVTVTIAQPAQNTETHYIYEVTVVLTFRPSNIAATEFSDTVRGALQGALSAIERQVRQKREKMRGH